MKKQTVLECSSLIIFSKFLLFLIEFHTRYLVIQITLENFAIKSNKHKRSAYLKVQPLIQPGYTLEMIFYHAFKGLDFLKLQII